MKNRKTLSLLLVETMTAALLTTPAQAAEYQPQTPAPYAISADHWSREDFSQEASPEVFTGMYSRELYNAIRQTMLDGTSDTAPAYTMVGKEDYSAVKSWSGVWRGCCGMNTMCRRTSPTTGGTWTTSPYPPKCRRTTKCP